MGDIVGQKSGLMVMNNWVVMVKWRLPSINKTQVYPLGAGFFFEYFFGICWNMVNDWPNPWKDLGKQWFDQWLMIGVVGKILIAKTLRLRRMEEMLHYLGLGETTEITYQLQQDFFHSLLIGWFRAIGLRVSLNSDRRGGSWTVD